MAPYNSQKIIKNEPSLFVIFIVYFKEEKRYYVFTRLREEMSQKG
jgi:hypothetical protein